MDPITVAAQEYLDRKHRRTHPAGRTDSGGRWYPADAERCTCCDYIRQPSRAFPWSLAHHCRTAGHVAALHGVSESDLRKAARALEQGVAA